VETFGTIKIGYCPSNTT